MAQVTVKLYASLASHLPAQAKDNAIKIGLPAEATIGAALAELRVPKERCHLVLLNGVFVPPAQRMSAAVADGDTIAAWPPVAGG